MRAGIFSGEAIAAEAELIERVQAQPHMKGASLYEEVATQEAYVVPAIGEKKFTVAAVDLGIKGMTPHRMAERGIEVHVLPATATVDDVYAVDPDGVFFSNGPGDPATADGPVALMRAVLERKTPLFRHLLRQPDPRPRPRLRHLQAEVRPPGHQPAGPGPHHRQGGDHRPQPRLRRGRTARQGQ
ncbi:hypothetical protein GCM10020256_65070 [Streptomyces thermocoprophilus]